MIEGKDDLFSRIENYSFNDNNQSSFNDDCKVKLLENSIDHSIRKICEDILEDDIEVHLAYSGGVDSSLILVKILQQGYSLVAHTIASNSDFPDVIYSKRFVNQLKEVYTNLNHKIHIMEISDDDIKKSNEILRIKKERPDEYFILMKAISAYTNKIICCDCIDELMGGYYQHKNPENYPEDLPFYDSKKSTAENRTATLNYFMSKLILDHLSILDSISSYFGIKVYLPYGSEEVMGCASRFNVNELIGDRRKKPIYLLAEENDINKGILNRRKFGLVSAFS